MIDCKDIRKHMDSISVEMDIVALNEVRTLYGLPMIPDLRLRNEYYVITDTRDQAVEIYRYAECDCNIVESNRKDCQHEIITDGITPSPPKLR